MKLCLSCNQYFEDKINQCPTDQTWLESVGKDPLIGALINNRYLVDSVIGKGSSGIVYRATRLGRGEMVVAIKVLHSFIGAAGSALDRFLREAQAATRLRNPHIITIWESGVTEDGQPYFVMDYLAGMTLTRLIKEKGQIEPKRVLSIMRQTCEALAEAHRLGITHRDLKPDNIVLQETGQGDDYVKLLDFGIADSPQHALFAYKMEKPRTVSGSPAYMSPEQCQGFELDGRSDIYSLAIVAFEMLTGTRPFRQSEDVNVMVLHVSEAPMTLSQARPDLNFPAAVENVFAHAFAKQPAQRQATIQDFFLSLEQAWPAFELQPIVNNKDASPAISTLNKLQQVAQTNATALPGANLDLNTVETEIARARTNANLANQPSLLGPPPARMSRTHNDLEVQAINKLRTDKEPLNQQTVTGTSTVQRLLKAVQQGQTSSLNNVVPVSSTQPAANARIPDKRSSAADSSPGTPANTTSAPDPSYGAPLIGLENTSALTKESQADAETYYVKQQLRNTISRLEGWKKPERTRSSAAMISTRAKAASIKADTIRRPINLWNVLLTITTLLCLACSAYVVYSALRTEIPRSVSVQYLARLGKYEQVKIILEQKQLIGPLNTAERDQLGLSYLNLAKSSLAKHQDDQALLLLARIDPQSASAQQGRKLRDKLIESAKPHNRAK